MNSEAQIDVLVNRIIKKSVRKEKRGKRKEERKKRNEVSTREKELKGI